MTVWIQNPFDNLPCEGYRKQRYWLMAEAFARAGHSVVLWTSDFSHGAKAPRQILDSDLAQRCGFTPRLIPPLPTSNLKTSNLHPSSSPPRPISPRPPRRCGSDATSAPRSSST